MAKGKKSGEGKDRVLIKNILSRFIKSELKNESFGTLKDLLELPITALKDLNEDEAGQITEIFGCETIEELAKLNPINPIESIIPEPKPDELVNPEKYENKAKELIEHVLKNIHNFENFRNHIAVAQMISRAWSKRAIYLKKKDTKVICVGLDNAGKTAILTGLGGKLGIAELGKLKPTKKIERKRISTPTMDLHIWDFGGQDIYRREYLAKPEMYFVGTDLLLYVLDMQDAERYNESFNYLTEIIDVIKLLGENPYILAFMHKSDPDVLTDPDFQLNSEYVADKLNYHIAKYKFEYDIYQTSIYNFFTSEPKFSRIIKETLSDKESLNNPMIRKIEGLGDILDTTLNAVINIANSLGEQMTGISQRLNDLELKVERLFVNPPRTGTQRRKTTLKKSKVKTQPQVIYTTIPEIKVENPDSAAEDSDDSRLLILKELSGLFQAKRKLDSSPLSLGSLGTKYKKHDEEE
jgi:hypothetical protein